MGAIERAIFRGVQDTRDALHYLVHHQAKIGFDPEQIYLAGSSAGGIIALTTAFMDYDEVYGSVRGIRFVRSDLGGLDDTGNEFKDSFKVAGVVSLWGGVTDLQMINNPIPTLLFHGTEDDIIPIDAGLPFKTVMGNIVHTGLSLLFGKLYGSEPIFDRLTYLNVPAKFVPFHGFGHDAHLEPDDTMNSNMDIICEETADFLYDHVSKHYFNYQLSGKTVVGKNDSTPVYQPANAGNVTIQWHVDGGLVTRQIKDSIRVIWYSSRETGTITACITDANGLSCKKELEVKIRE
jgi:pimeloyl-ACP methyl ester carboxylesterase